MNYRRVPEEENVPRIRESLPLAYGPTDATQIWKCFIASRVSYLEGTDGPNGGWWNQVVEFKLTERQCCAKKVAKACVCLLWWNKPAQEPRISRLELSCWVLLVCYRFASTNWPLPLGDLAKKKTYPALFHLYRFGLIPKETIVVGYGRSPMTRDDFLKKTVAFA